MMDDQYGFDINLDFLDSSTSNIKPNVENTAVYQQDQEQPDLDIESLATRIASVNELTIQLKTAKREYVKLQKQMQDLSDSAMSIRCMYEREKVEKAKYALLSKELKEKCEIAESQLTNKTLHFEQLTSQFEQSAPKGPISYNELALRYQRLALQLDEDKQLNSKEKILLQQIQVYMEYKKLTALPAFKKRSNVKAETETTCAIVLPIKKETRNQGTQYTKYTTARGTSPPAKSPQREKRTQGTQYISSTTTRGTSTSTFIKQHTIGTNFPEVVPVSIEDIFKEMICNVSPLSPMRPSSPPVTEIESPRMKKMDMKSVGTITGLKNVRKQIDYVPVNIKYSDSRPPSRNMNDRIKSEWPFMGMPSMNPFSGLGISPPPMHSTVAELWSMLGHTIFALLQNGNSQLNTMHANVVNDRLRNISADMNRRRDQPRANDERMREGNSYFGEDRDYAPSTKNTGTSPVMDMGSSQDFRFDGTYMNSEAAPPAFVSVNSNQGKDNLPVEIQKILLNKNVQTNEASERTSSRVDDILQLFPQNTHSLENRKAIKRLLKASKQERTHKKMPSVVSEDGECSPVLTQTNWDLFGTSGEESNHNGCSSTSPFQSPNTRTLGSSSGGSSTIREMPYEPPKNDVFLGFDDDSDKMFCKPFLPPKQSRAPMSTNENKISERTTNQQTPGMEVENARSSFSPIPLRENASKAKRKRRASKSVSERANKLFKTNVSGSVTDVVSPTGFKSPETAPIFDLQFRRSSSFSKIAAPLKKRPVSSNFNHITAQWHQNSEQTPEEVSSPLLNEFAALTQNKPHINQYPSNSSKTAMLGNRNETCRDPVRQKNSNFLQFVKSDSQSSRDVTSPNSSVYNSFSLSQRVLSLPATPAPSEKRSSHCGTQSEGPVSVLSRVLSSESQPQSENTSPFKEPKSDGEDSVYSSKSPSWETDCESKVLEGQSESNSCESTACSEENTLHLATPRDGSLPVQNNLNSHRLSAEDNQLIFKGFKSPEPDEPATPALSNQMPTNSQFPTIPAVRTQYWDSEGETSNSSFADQLDETSEQDKEKIKFNEEEEEDKKLITLLDQMSSNSYESQTPVSDTCDSDEAESPPLAVKISDQAQSQGPVPINEFNGSMTSREEKPANTRHSDDETFDSHELNAGLSSSDSSADLSIDCPPSPQPHDASSLDLSLLLKTPEKNTAPQFKTPPESSIRNTSLLNKVLTSSTENLVDEFLNANSIKDEPKFQMFLSKIMGEVAPPLSPISVLATSETPLNSETESSCDESAVKAPRRNKANLPATAAMAVKRSARLRAKVGTNTGRTLPLQNIPLIELGKYTKRRIEVRTPLKIPKAELKREKAENKVDIIGNIRLGFFKDLMEEHDSSTEALVIDNVAKECNSATYPTEFLDPVLNRSAYDNSADVAEEVNVGIPVIDERLPKFYTHEDLSSISSPSLSTDRHATLFVGQILEQTKEGTWQPKTFDPICFGECPASPPPQDQVPEESHVTRQCAESAPLLGRPTSNLSVISHIIANYNKNYHNLIKPDLQSKKLNELQSVIIDFMKGLCLIMDTVRTVDTLLSLTTCEKLIATALVSVAKTAPRPETEVPPPVPDHYISQALDKLLCLIEQLHHQLPGLRRSIQAVIEQSLFSFTKEIIPLEVLMNLTQFYLATLAEPTATSNPARLFICKCLYFYNQKATPMIYQTLCVYPSVLPKRDDATYDRSDALISAIQCLLMSTFYDMEKTDLKTKQMLTKLRNFYNYESFKPPRDEFLDNLIAKIRAGRIKNVSYAFALICKRMDQRNAEKAVLGERLLPLANEYYQALGQTHDNDVKIACVLECISFVIKPFAVETDISPYVNLFGRFLNASDRQIIQEAALAALLRTIRFGYVNCFNAIYNFKPNYELADETKAMLRSFVYKKTLLFLKRLEHQARMLGSI